MNSALVWDMDPVMLQLGSYTLNWYSFFLLLGWFMGCIILSKLWIEGGNKPIGANIFFNYSLIGGFIGARLVHYIFYDFDIFLANPLKIFGLSGGLASHGGYLGIIISGWIFVKINGNKTFLWITDRITFPSILCGGFIRIGNFFNSEILGKPSDLPWAVIFKKVDSVPRHPVQIYEALGYLSISLSLYGIYRYYEKKPIEGRLLGLAFIIAFSFRFLIEFFKENQSMISQGMPLNMGQLLSIPFILAGIFLVSGLYSRFGCSLTGYEKTSTFENSDEKRKKNNQE